MNTIDWKEITKSQFNAYNRVRENGHFNMIMEADKARIEAGLNANIYWTIISHYDELKKKFEM